MLGSFFLLLILVTIGSVAGILGGIILLIKKNWAKSLASYSIPLAAGVLLAVSFLDLLPEAVSHIQEAAYSIMLLVFVVAFLIEKFLFTLHHHDVGHKRSYSAIPMVIFGDTIHNFLDGVAITASFMVNPSLGVIVAFSTFLHETPHEIADFGILLSAGWSRSKVFWANLLSALATFPGALLTYFFLGVSEKTTGVLLALASGLFLYVAATDFLPELVEHRLKGSALKQSILLLCGIALMVLIGILFPEVGG